MPLIIDIETTSWFKDENHKQLVCEERQDSRLKDPEKIAENHKKIIAQAALSPYTGQVTVVGLYDPRGKTEMFTNGYEDPIDKFTYKLSDEKALLEMVWRKIDEAVYAGERLVSFAGKDFDLPYLFVRSAINGITTNAPYMDLIHPYNHDLHLDMKAIFDKGRLKEIAYALDCQTDNEIDGSELPELWHTDPGKVVDKCKSDLIQTAKIYERVKLWIPQRLQIFPKTE